MKIKMKKKRKAFTLLELVIVIAVIAILAAVLIPTFSSIIRRGNESNTIQTVRNLNTALLLDDPTQNHQTVRSVLAAINGIGYDTSKLDSTKNKFTILWDSVNDMFCYLNDKGNIT